MFEPPSRPRHDRKIFQLYAWIAESPEGGERIIAASQRGLIIPMVGADMQAVERYRRLAERTVTTLHRPARLKQFGHAVVLDEIAPG